MIKVLLFTCLAGLVAAQYGRGGSGYGPDGVRNRYFILGHGRGPISTSLGSGIYGASLGSSSSYRPSSHEGSGYSAPARSSGYGSSGHGSSGYGSSGHGSSGYGSSGHGSSGYGGSSLGGYGGHQSYAPAAPAHSQSYAPAHDHSYAPAPVQSYAPAPRAYAPAHQSYAPAVSSYSAPSSGYNAPARSYGGHHDDYAQPTPYDYGYDVHNEHGDQQSRQESGDGYGNVKGSYGYKDAYGIFRHVDYVADKDGFRANVRTNEPGTDNQDPADVKMQVEHGGYGY